MAEKKKTTVGATVPPPEQNADFLTQLEQTFQRGVVSAEVDLMGLFAREGGGSIKTMFGEAARVSEGPSGVHDRIFQRMKEIANAFGGRFTVHAPIQADPSGITEVEKARAAAILKDTIRYAKKLGASVITVHPIGSMGYYFIEPISGQKMPVENPFILAKNENELNELFEKYNVKDPLLREQIKKERENFIQVLPSYLAEKFGVYGSEFLDRFIPLAAQKAFYDLISKYGSDIEKIKKELSKYHPSVANAAISEIEKIVAIAGNDKEKLKRIIENVKAELGKRVKSEEFNKALDVFWAKYNLASVAPLSKDGRFAKHGKEEMEIRKKAWETIMGEIAPRFGPFKDSEKMILENVKKTFEHLLSDREVQEMLKRGKIKIAIENLFPAVPEKGYMAGFAYFYKPEHMAKLIKELRAIAKAKGIPEDKITMTFDIAHAASSGIKPSKFLEELKKQGIKPGHVHIVGGRGFGHEHIAWGDWLDEVSRMDPEIFKKVVELGVVNIEGGVGHHDIEVTLNAMWDQGMPLEAILAIAGGPRPTPELLRYAGFGDIGYWKSKANFYWSSGFAQKAMYSFQYAHIPAPMQTAFGPYTAPGLWGGGYSIGPGRTPAVWSSAQPFLYSTSKKNNW